MSDPFTGAEAAAEADRRYRDSRKAEAGLTALGTARLPSERQASRAVSSTVPGRVVASVAVATALGIAAAVALLPWLAAVGTGLVIAFVALLLVAAIRNDFGDFGPLVLGGGVVLALVISILSAIVNVTGAKAFLTGQGHGGSSTVASAVAREINRAGSYGFAGYDHFQGVTDEGHGDVAVRTDLADKADNEQAARYMCGSMMTIRLQDGLAELDNIRILSSTDTTLAYCN